MEAGDLVSGVVIVLCLLLTLLMSSLLRYGPGPAPTPSPAAAHALVHDIIPISQRLPIHHPSWQKEHLHPPGQPFHSRRQCQDGVGNFLLLLETFII